MGRTCVFIAAIFLAAALVATPPTATKLCAQSIVGFPQGPRNYGMAWTGVADDSQPTNVFYNPANLAFLEGFAWNASRLNWFADIDFFDVGVFGGREISVGGRHVLNVSASARCARMYTADDRLIIFTPDGTLREYRLSDWSVPLTLAAGLSTRYVDLGLGTTVKFVASEIGDDTPTTTAFDFGLLVKRGFDLGEGVVIGISGGLSALNRGRGLTYSSSEFELPREYRAGVSMGFAGFSPEISASKAVARISSNVDFVDERDRDGSSYGVEFGIFDTLFIRAGHRDVELFEGGDYWGVGITTRISTIVFSADYAKPTDPSEFAKDHLVECLGVSGAATF